MKLFYHFDKSLVEEALSDATNPFFGIFNKFSFVTADHIFNFSFSSFLSTTAAKTKCVPTFFFVHFHVIEISFDFIRNFISFWNNFQESPFGKKNLAQLKKKLSPKFVK